jgi:hypothetical protein
MLGGAGYAAEGSTGGPASEEKSRPAVCEYTQRPGVVRVNLITQCLGFTPTNTDCLGLIAFYTLRAPEEPSGGATIAQAFPTSTHSLAEYA